MAEDFVENEYTEAEITKIQALFRGILVRKWMNETRKEYDDIFKEVETNSQTGPIWICEGLCKPIFQKKANKRKTQREIDSSVRDTSKQTMSTQAELKNGATRKCKDTKELCEVGVQSASQAFDHDFLTVETQTSFCESSTPTQDIHKIEQCVTTETETGEHGVLNIQDIPEKNKESKQTDISKTLIEVVKESNHCTELAAEKFIPDNITKESAISWQNESSKQITTNPPKGIPSPRGNHGIPVFMGTSGQTNETSVWDSFHSISAPATESKEVQQEREPHQYPQDKESLQEMRKNIALELLWVQQAINSRKNYLKLKGQIAV
ncbi:uncharacterized protein LOC133189381 isoform X2 [Saccostrea echinata]|uniref:uncharacterized protein LOC133189381 isoform X2 n=1 Tax=Saccostrea echinata TaxID=191078 RepID=UPI002A83B2CF|nr:uncharacterized protein LOC133189381 isoform X2 [Saccostrea echinata]